MAAHAQAVQEVLDVVVQEQIHDVIQQLLRFTAKACYVDYGIYQHVLENAVQHVAS
jgi:hypothetical protein